MVNALLLAVFSDTHGVTEPMFDAVEQHKPDIVLHLGDHTRDAEALQQFFPSLDVRYVRGNCDHFSDAPEVLEFSADRVPVFMTHGHRYNVKYTLDSLINAAGFSGARLALFGHTHQSEYKTVGGLTLFNPGSAGMGRQTYALITVKGADFQCRLEEL